MELQVQPSEFGLEEAKAKELVKDLTITLKERELLKEAFLDVSELEVTEENIPTFKELRLKIVKNRTQGIEKWHKAQKAFYLAGGRFVDAIKNKEVAVNVEMETKLMDAEKYFENLEKERIAKVQSERAEKLSKYMDDVSHIDLGNMDDEIWNAYYAAKKKEYEDRIEAEKKAEAERLERERLDELERKRRLEIAPYMQFIDDGVPELRDLSDKEFDSLMDGLKKAKVKHDKEQEEIRKENERLKKEREAAEAKRLEEEKKRKSEEAKKEAEHQAQLKKEREAREELERKERQRKEAEAKAKAEAEAEAKRLEKAPIKEKLTKWVNEFEIPETTVDNEVSKEIKAKFESFKKWSINQVNNL